MNRKLTLCLLLLSLISFSQTPQLINYQGAARNSNGLPIVSTAVDLRFELRQGSASSPTVFAEDQTVTTSSLGLFSTQIGKMPGSNFNAVNWQSGSLFLEVSMRLPGGTYTSLGAQQLVSVPYSMYAQSVPATYTNNILTIGANAFTLSPATGAVYTASTGISITSGSIITNTSPDLPVTFTSSSTNIAINGAYPNFGISYTSTPSPTSLTLNGANNNSLSAGNNTVVLNTYTVGSGLNIAGGPNYTITSAAISPTIHGAGIITVNPLSGNNFTVSIPNPSISVSNTLLTLTQGTAISTATLNPPSLTLSGANNNSLSAGNNTVALNTYTAGAGLTITGGPNYTISSSAVSPSIQAAGVASVSPLSGSSFTVTVPNPSVAVTAGSLLTLSQGTSVSTATLNTYVAGSGISFAGGPSYTINSSAANHTIQGAGVAAVSPTSGTNFTVTVPNPSVAVTAGTLLTLSQGTSVSTTTLNSYAAGAGLTLSGGPNYTISSSAASPTIQGTGVAAVSPSVGTNFTVTVPNPSVAVTGGTLLTLSQGTSVSTATLNTYAAGPGISFSGGPNYTISSSAASPSIQGGGVASVTPLSGSSYTVSVPNPSITASGTLLTLSQGTAVSTTALDFYSAGPGISISSGPNHTVTSLITNPSIQGAGVASVATSGSNYTVNVPNPGITIAGTLLTLSQGASVSTATINPPSLTLSGANNNNLSAGNNTVVLNTYTAGSGISISGGPNYTITSSATTPSIQGAGVASVSTSGSNYTVTVPNPAITTSGTLLTLTQGTVVSTATLPTPTLTGSGIATISGGGLNYNVDVITPTIMATGASNVTGSFPSYTINTIIPPTATVTGTGAAVVTPTTGLSFVVNVPLSSVTSTTGIATITSAGTNSFNINVPAPSYNAGTGALNTGTATTNITQVLTFTNNILTAGPASNSVTLPANINTSISPAGSASVTGFFPSFTVSAPASPSITGTGLAVVSPSTGANITVNVPLLTYTSSSGLLGSGSNTVDITSPLSLNGTTLTSGPASNSINLNGLSPFTTTGASIYQTTLSNSVGIGTNAPAAKLDVVESVAYTGIHLRVQNINTTNASNMVDLSSNGTGFALNAFNNNASTTAYAGMFDGGIRARGKTTNNTGYTIRALDFSGNDLFAVRNDGNVGVGTSAPFARFEVNGSNTTTNSIIRGTNNNSANPSPVIDALTNGATGMYVTNTNVAPGSNAANLVAAGGSALLAQSSSSTDAALLVNQTSATLGAYAGVFTGGIITKGKNSTITDYALRAQNSGASDLLTVRNDGNVGIRSINSAYDLSIYNAGSSTGLQLINSATTNGFVISQSNTAAYVYLNENMPMYFGTNSATRMTILANGNVGIGTTSPNGNFHVHSTGASILNRITSAAATTGLVSYIDGSSAALLNYENTPLYFGTNGANRMVISNTGAVGINNSSPSATLDVVGTVKIADGTQGSGKVLTSDAVGNASWQALSPVPSGAIMAYGGTAIPTGWLLCDGTSYLRATYPNLFTAISTAWGAADGTHFNVPDMRGMFLRGVDGGAGNDPDKTTRTAINTGGNTGNNVGSEQTDQFQSHIHSITGLGATIANTSLVGSVYTPGGSTNTNATGGNETRPMNVYVYYIIKQ